jgi:hypothetical protein
MSVTLIDIVFLVVLVFLFFFAQRFIRIAGILAGCLLSMRLG